MTWDLDPVLINIGPATIRYYGVCFLIALLGGFRIWRAQMLRGGRTEEDAEKFLIIGVLAVIIGARVGHVVFYEWERFSRNPIEIFYFWRGGLASHGATAGLIIGLYLFSRIVKMSYIETGDRLMIATAWAASWVRIGNFTNSEIVGRVTDLPWGVRFPRYDWNLPLAEVPARHPSQLYEALMGAAIFLVLWAVDRKLGEKRPRGLMTALFLTLYFSCRFLVEFFKEYQALDPGASTITMGQYLSIPFALAGAAGLLALAVKNRRPNG